MTDITPILQAIFLLLTALVSAFVIPWLKNKVGAQNLDLFLAWVDIAVAAAEQLYDSMDGEKKKAYVVSFLASKGFKVDTEELDNAIEAAVLKLHNELYGWAEVLHVEDELEAVPDD